MRDFVHFDSSKFPIVVSKYFDFIPTQEEFIKAQRDLEEFINKYYTPSVVAQLMMRSVFMVVKPAVPYAVVTSLEKAQTWASRQLRR